MLNLDRRRHDFDDRIEKSGRPNDLLDDSALGPLEFVLGRSRAHKDDFVEPLFPFGEFERPVVVRAREPESVIDEVLFARAVARIHGADLGHGNVRLVDEHKKVFGEEVEQRFRRDAGRAIGERRAVILDSRAEPALLH